VADFWGAEAMKLCDSIVPIFGAAAKRLAAAAAGSGRR